MGDAIPVQEENDVWIYYKNGIFHVLRVDIDDIKINSISFGESHCGIITGNNFNRILNGTSLFN